MANEPTANEHDNEALAMVVIHCATCTCSLPVEDCPGEQVVGHETFTCYGNRGHDGPHWAIRQIPPCPTCGGYDEHREGCADIALVTPDSERFEWETSAHIGTTVNPSESTDQGQW